MHKQYYSGGKKTETPDAKEKRDVASIYNEEEAARAIDLSNEGRLGPATGGSANDEANVKSNHPIGGLEVLANSRKMTAAAATSPISLETANFLKQGNNLGFIDLL